MNLIIWKFKLEIVDIQEIFLPDGAELLSVANQGESLCLWAIVDPSKEKRNRCIEIIKTGELILMDATIYRKFIGTVVISPFVWHVFESGLIQEENRYT